MRNFEYYNPTKVYFGKKTEERAGELVKSFGGTKVLIHYGGGSARRSGVLDRVEKSLETAGISFVTLGGVVPNPRLSLVQEGVAVCKQEEIDFILAVGGGSVIDSAKAIAYGAVYEDDVWNFFCGKAQPKACLSLGSVLTIAAAGSETSNASVITNEEGWYKKGYMNDLSRPKFAIMNPELTYTLPPYQTACGITDIMMHTIERYFNLQAEDELTDGLSESLLRNVMKNAPILLTAPTNYNARAEVMWAGSLAHNDLLNGGNGRGDWGTHRMEHEVGALFDVAHGAGLAALWGSWARCSYKKDIGRFAKFVHQVLDVPEDPDQEKMVFAGIRVLEGFFRKIVMPISLTELGVTPTGTEIEAMANKATNGDTIKVGGFSKLTKADIIKIYTMAR